MLAQTPRRFIAWMRSNCSRDSSAASVAGTMMPALLKAMSRRPYCSTAALTRLATWSSSATSQRTPNTSYPLEVSVVVAS